MEKIGFRDRKERTEGLGTKTRYPGSRIAGTRSPGRAKQLCVGHGVDVGTHHAHFIILLVQIVEQDVAERYHANQVAFVANGQVTETVAPHP